ncbi:MAG TPA: hypothetical protein VK623_06530 [Flavobacterium sp.]|nr:hypothetical protein [Flavobacterium sp.]
MKKILSFLCLCLFSIITSCSNAEKVTSTVQAREDDSTYSYANLSETNNPYNDVGKDYYDFLAAMNADVLKGHINTPEDFQT